MLKMIVLLRAHGSSFIDFLELSLLGCGGVQGDAVCVQCWLDGDVHFRCATSFAAWWLGLAPVGGLYNDDDGGFFDGWRRRAFLVLGALGGG